MLCVISPAKRLDWSDTHVVQSTPEFEEDAISLAKTMRRLPLRDIKSLMKLSDDLAQLNRDRFQAFDPSPDMDNTRPAAFAFAGDTYVGLDARNLSEEDIDYAQDHLRILSGLYGVLRPKDAIQPYRLEMGTRLKTRRGQSLYAYWKDAPAKALNAQAASIDTDIVVNCASQEYFGAIDRKALIPRVVTPNFQEIKAGAPKTIGFFAKKARGAMARYLVQNRVTDLSKMLEFDVDGYAYDPELSKPDTPVFTRAYRTASKST